LKYSSENKELERRFNMLRTQKEEEDRARNIGQYAKKQRVSYHHRGSNKQYDAIIVGVHFDDGPTNPYYVSRNCRKYRMQRQRKLLLLSGQHMFVVSFILNKNISSHGLNTGTYSFVYCY
jgi:hypothetical protein